MLQYQLVFIQPGIYKYQSKTCYIVLISSIPIDRYAYSATKVGVACLLATAMTISIFLIFLVHGTFLFDFKDEH